MLVMAKMHELKFELLSHSAYSPGWSPYDFHLFLNLNKQLGGKKFSRNVEVIATVNSYVKVLIKMVSSPLKFVETKCTDLKDDYIGK